VIDFMWLSSWIMAQYSLPSPGDMVFNIKRFHWLHSFGRLVIRAPACDFTYAYVMCRKSKDIGQKIHVNQLPIVFLMSPLWRTSTMPNITATLTAYNSTPTITRSANVHDVETLFTTTVGCGAVAVISEASASVRSMNSMGAASVLLRSMNSVGPLFSSNEDENVSVAVDIVALLVVSRG